MHHKNISLQGAVNLAGNMIKDAFATFRSLEHSLLKSVDPKKGGAAATTATGLPPIFSWKWTSLLPPSHNNNNSSSETFNNNETQLIAIQNYITRLKDCIVGTVNWLYETELYFGKKGSEIRTFGWVFINPIAVD
jgi:hypothetical protein